MDLATSFTLNSVQYGLLFMLAAGPDADRQSRALANLAHGSFCMLGAYLCGRSARLAV
jgi:branched-subunit amino acid ABC-type transport system permease component